MVLVLIMWLLLNGKPSFQSFSFLIVSWQFRNGKAAKYKLALKKYTCKRIFIKQTHKLRTFVIIILYSIDISERCLFSFLPLTVIRVSAQPNWSFGLGAFSMPGNMNYPLHCERKYSIIVWLSHRPSACGKAALVGESAVPCNLQSAIAGMNSHPRSESYCLTYISGVEESVPRNGIP